METDTEFFERRIAEERAAAARATCAVARERHSLLVDLYTKQLGEMRSAVEESSDIAAQGHG